MPPTALATALVRMRHVRDSVRDGLLASPATRPGWVLPTLVGAPQLLLAACLVFRGVRERTRRRKQQRGGGLHGGGRFQRVALAPSESEPPSPHLTQGIEGVSELLSRQAAAHADLLRPQPNSAVAAVGGGGGGFRLTEKQRDLLSRAVVAPPPGMPAAPLPTPPPQLLPWTAATAAAAAAAAGPRPATPSDSTAAAAASAALASAQARLQERLLLESRAALPPTAAAALVAAATAPTSLVGATVPARASLPRVPPSVATASDVDGAARRGMERVRHEHAVQQERAAALQQAASSELEARFRSRVEAAQTQTQCGSSAATRDEPGRRRGAPEGVLVGFE